MSDRREFGNATDAYASGQALPVPTWLVAFIIAVSLGTAMYHLLGGLFGPAEAFRHRTAHISLFLVLAFLGLFGSQIVKMITGGKKTAE